MMFDDGGYPAVHGTRRAGADLITFHGGKRAFLSETFAMLELRVKLYMLVGKLEIALDLEWEDWMTAAWPLGPRGLRLVFKQSGCWMLMRRGEVEESDRVGINLMGCYFGLGGKLLFRNKCVAGGRLEPVL